MKLERVREIGQRSDRQQVQLTRLLAGGVDDLGGATHRRLARLGARELDTTDAIASVHLRRATAIVADQRGMCADRDRDVAPAGECQQIE